MTKTGAQPYGEHTPRHHPPPHYPPPPPPTGLCATVHNTRGNNTLTGICTVFLMVKFIGVEAFISEDHRIKPHGGGCV